MATNTDWLSFVPAGEARVAKAFIDLPAFSYAALGAVGVASIVVAQFNFSASRAFYLVTLPIKPVGVNFGLCIRYRVGDQVFRYKLWEDPAFILASASLYDRHLIKKNFVLEVWNFSGVQSSNAASLRMITSVRSIPTDFRELADYALAVGAEFLQLNSLTVTPSSAVGLLADYSANAAQCEFDMSSNRVSQIADLSGNGRNLYQALDSKRPSHSLWSPEAVAFPHDTISFDGVDDVLTWTGAGATGDGGLSVYIVGCIKANLQWFTLTGAHMFSTAPTPLTVGQIAISGVYGLYSDRSGVTTYGVSGSPLVTSSPLNQMHLIEAFCRVGSTDIFADGVLLGTNNNVVTGVNRSSAGILASGPTTSINIGGTPSSSFLNLRVARVLVYGTQHTYAVRSLVRQYLEGIYLGGVPLALTFDSGGPWLDNT